MVGELFPRDEPRSTTSRAEQALWRALRAQLPRGWWAWHSLRLRAQDGWEGEGDFVLADPERGLLVLEVKGGAISLRGGHWYQYERRLSRAPRDQAQGFVRRLVDAVAARCGARPPYGVAVAFPETDFSAPPTTGDLDGLVIGARELPYLAEVLPALMRRALPDGRLPRDRRWLEALRELWGETWVPTVSLSHRADDARARRVALDDEQLKLLDFAGQAPRVHVTGSAGSGKTVVAMELCRRRAAAGQQVHFVCFTDALGAAVGRELAALGGRARATPIRRLALELLRAAGLPVRTDDPSFWASASLEAAASALPPASALPDLLVVDEAQDLEEADWTLVEELARGRDLWLFSDERQQFWAERRVPESLAQALSPMRLLRQHRNPGPVWRFACGYLASPPEGAGAGDDGAPVALVEATADRLERSVAHQLSELRRGGAEPGEIAVVTLAGQTLSEVWGRDRIGSHPVCRADDAAVGDAIACDTFLRFKGLERPYVILTELASGRGSRYDTRMHIAATRATVRLIIVCTPEAVEADPRLAALRGG